MRYSLWRILGNDLPPRHASNQTWDNLQFILENESKFAECEKGFILNRIVDTGKVLVYKEAIEKHGHKWYEIPFDLKEYAAAESKEAYLTNLNPARNQALRLGLADDVVEVVMPFDGASFFRDDAWQAFDMNVRLNPHEAYWAFPQWRVPDYLSAIDCSKTPCVKEVYYFGKNTQRVGMRELTLGFSSSADAWFNEALPYAKVDKVELLWRLGLFGVWDAWEPQVKQRALVRPSKYFGQVKMPGSSFVIRLPSGNREADENNQVRGQQRFDGVQALVRKADNLLKESGQ